MSLVFSPLGFLVVGLPIALAIGLFIDRDSPRSMVGTIALFAIAAPVWLFALFGFLDAKNAQDKEDREANAGTICPSYFRLTWQEQLSDDRQWCERFPEFKTASYQPESKSSIRQLPSGPAVVDW